MFSKIFYFVFPFAFIYVLYESKISNFVHHHKQKAEDLRALVRSLSQKESDSYLPHFVQTLIFGSRSFSDAEDDFSAFWTCALQPVACREALRKKEALVSEISEMISARKRYMPIITALLLALTAIGYGFTFYRWSRRIASVISDTKLPGAEVKPNGGDKDSDAKRSSADGDETEAEGKSVPLNYCAAKAWMRGKLLRKKLAKKETNDTKGEAEVKVDDDRGDSEAEASEATNTCEDIQASEVSEVQSN